MCRRPLWAALGPLDPVWGRRVAWVVVWGETLGEKRVQREYPDPSRFTDGLQPLQPIGSRREGFRWELGKKAPSKPLHSAGLSSLSPKLAEMTTDLRRQARIKSPQPTPQDSSHVSLAWWAP